MIQRCTNPKREKWDRYGGRGIKVHPSWLLFKNFLAYMGERPPGTSLDRWPNNDGNYEPGNCRWATPQQQSANQKIRSTAVLIDTPWGRLPVSEAARKSGLKITTLFYRIKHGWSDKDLFRVPSFAGRT